jgi:hypothetical protein
MNTSLFNDFLIKIGEHPLLSIAPDDSTGLLEIEISEMEDKMGLPHELTNEEKEVTHE